MFDYETLRLIWWGLMGFLLAGFAVMDGFDLGVAALLPWVARDDMERRITINTVAAVWEGNQVWFILGGGVLFAAWPYLYAVSFSGFYLAMFLVLLTFILRPVGFKYRSKLPSQRWRASWDWILSISGGLAALVFGVAVGNVLQGVPFYFDSTLRVFYTGTLWQLFNPFALLCGVVSVTLLCMQGASYLVVKTTAAVRARAIRFARVMASLMLVTYAVGGLWVAQGIRGYVLQGPVNPAGPSTPLHQVVTRSSGAWLQNYLHHPWLWCVPALAIGFALLMMGLLKRGVGKCAFVCSSASVFLVVCTVGVSMFPFILPSSLDPSNSLSVWNASASQRSLWLMWWSTVIFFPIIIAYTAWVYRVLRGKVTAETVKQHYEAY